MNKILIGFSKHNDAQMIALAKSVEAGTVNNELFKMHKALIDEFVVASRAFEKAVPKKNTRNTENAAAKNLKRQELTKVMVSLAYAIMSVARGNREILSTSGFELSSLMERSGPPDIPQNVEGKYNATPSIDQIRLLGKV